MVFDPIAANRTATVASLRSLGIRNVRLAATLDALTSILEASAPDLIFCEAQGAEADVCKLIQLVRHGSLSGNPFAVIAATTWRRDGECVNQLLVSGADDLLARPFSTAVLAERLRMQIERRKNFVVTADYVGPDRRRDVARSGDEFLSVPNSLQLKTEPGADLSEAESKIAEAIKDARGRLNREKMRRCAFQLCVQWRLLERRSPGRNEYQDILDRIEAINSEISRRAAEEPDHEALGFTKSIATPLEALKSLAVGGKAQGQTSSDATTPARAIGDSALSLSHSFCPGVSREAHLAEIDAIVARIDPPAAAVA